MLRKPLRSSYGLFVSSKMQRPSRFGQRRPSELQANTSRADGVSEPAAAKDSVFFRLAAGRACVGLGAGPARCGVLFGRLLVTA